MFKRFPFLVAKLFQFTLPQQALFSSKIGSFQHFCSNLETLSKASSRNEGVAKIQELMKQYLQLNNEKMFSDMLRLLLCKNEGEDMMIANTTMISIVQSAFPSQDLKQFMADNGDIGLFVRHALEKQQIGEKKQITQEVSVSDIVEIFQQISQTTGQNSRKLKEEAIKEVFLKLSDPISLQFFVRILTKNLRIGHSEKGVIKAMNNIAQEDKTVMPLLERIQNNVFKYNTGLISTLTVGVPCKPMLAKSVGSFDDLLKFVKKYEDKRISLELKYDGERSQIHFDEGKDVSLFSRNLESQNQKYPQLAQRLREYLTKLGIKQCILDGEILVTNSKGDIKSFFEQQIKRKRKIIKGKEESLQIDEAEEKLFLFDILLLDEEDYTSKDQLTRKQAILKYIPAEGPIQHAQSCEFDLSVEGDVQKTIAKVSEYIKSKEEGVIVKSLDQTTFYSGEGRTQWAKLKKQVVQGGVADTIDVVPLAAFYGKGKRSGQFGAYLIGCYDKSTNEYYALCKIGTGFSDEFLQESTERLQKHSTNQKPANYNISKALKPDVWLKESEVWEVECDCLTESPKYLILKQDTKGLSLRFPRFKKIRTDKSPKDSTSPEQLMDLFNSQTKKTKTANEKE